MTLSLPIPWADFHRAGHPPAFAHGQPDECPLCPLDPCPACGGERDLASLRFCPSCRRLGSAALTDGRMAVRPPTLERSTR